jgi:hypothetical protein
MVVPRVHACGNPERTHLVSAQTADWNQRPGLEPRIFEGRVLPPEEQAQICEEIIQFAPMEYVSPRMRELIMDVWPELAHKLPSEDATPVSRERVAFTARRCDGLRSPADEPLVGGEIAFEPGGRTGLINFNIAVRVPLGVRCDALCSRAEGFGGLCKISDVSQARLRADAAMA